MKPEEIIYKGYVSEHSEIDIAETTEAVDTFLGKAESLIPSELQDDIIPDAMYLLEMGQKQGFMAGFRFALDMLGASNRLGKTKEVDNVA